MIRNANPQTQIKRTYIRFTQDMPVDVKLDGAPEGRIKEQPSNPGQVDWQYIVNDGTAIMYLTAAARNQLLRTQAQAGDILRIVKTGLDSWQVSVLSDTTEDAPPAPPQRAARPAPPPLPVRSPASGYQRTANAIAAQPEQQPQQPQHSGSLVELMGTCFVLAARSLQAAHTQITQNPAWQDLEPPTWEDIRSTAASLFIERNKQTRDAR